MQEAEEEPVVLDLIGNIKVNSRFVLEKQEYFLALKRPRNNNTPNNNEHTKSPDLGF